MADPVSNVTYHLLGLGSKDTLLLGVTLALAVLGCGGWTEGIPALLGRYTKYETCTILISKPSRLPTAGQVYSTRLGIHVIGDVIE